VGIKKPWKKPRLTIGNDYWFDSMKLFNENPRLFGSSLPAFLDDNASGVLSISQYHTAREKLKKYRNGSLVRNGGVTTAPGKYGLLEDELRANIEDPTTRKMYILGGKTKGTANEEAIRRKVKEIAGKYGHEHHVVETKWIKGFVRRNAPLFSVDGGPSGTDNKGLPVFDILKMGEEMYIKYSMAREDGGSNVSEEKKVAFFAEKFRVLKRVPIDIRKNYGMQVVVKLKSKLYDGMLVSPYDIRPGVGRLHSFRIVYNQVSGGAWGQTRVVMSLWDKVDTTQPAPLLA
jgi:hypothetical protein